MDERTAKREVVDPEVALTVNGKACRARLYDLSMDGCMIDIAGSFAAHAGDAIGLDLPDAGAIQGTLIWTRGPFGGAKFTPRLHQQLVTRLGFHPRPQPASPFRDQFGRRLTHPRQRFSL